MKRVKRVLNSLPFFFFFGPAVCIAQESHLAINAWGLSHHVERNKNYNERNWGLGLRNYQGNWFAGVDYMRNSVRGQALSIGGGYEYPVTTITGYTFSVAVEAAHLDYQFPGRGTAHGWILLPGASIKKENLAVNLGFVPSSGKRGNIALLFVTWHLPNF